MPETSTFLGIDFGEAKIGLAIADEETRLAFAFDTLRNDSEFWRNIKEIAKCENVKTAVVGMTKHEKDSASAEAKRKFAEKLSREIGVPVEFHEEMFTTKMAQDNIRQRGVKGAAKYDDQEAARIILQSWLDKIP